MSMKEEIKKRLQQNDQDFAAGLVYGIKLWKSNNFYYMSKYEVIFQFFLDGIQQFANHLAELGQKEFDDKWQIINEFLLLPCPSNALPPSIIQKLQKVFSKLDSNMPSIRPRAFLESCLIVAFNIKYKNFYKFDYMSYGKVLQITLSYYLKYLEHSFNKNEEEKTIRLISDDIRIYVKSAGDDENWRAAFTLVLPSLCEVSLRLKSHGLDCQENLLELLKQVYFQDGNGSKYNRVLDQSRKHLLMNYFETDQLPVHVIALLIEGYLRAYRETKLDILLFLKYILLYVFVEPEKSIVLDIHQIFQLTSYVFHLMKKYFIKVDQKLVEDFDFTGIITVKLKTFLEKYGSSESCLGDLFSLICGINEYNPLILETIIIDIILRTMFIKKGPQTLERYQAVIVSTIESYVKLNRSENFREELFLKLDDYLDDHDLGEQLKQLRNPTNKRKSGLDEETPAKRRILENGEVAGTDSMECEYFFKLLLPSQKESSTKIVRLQLQDQWKSLSFAWPDANGVLSQSMLDYVKGLLTKRSFVYWRKMQEYLAEILESIAEEQCEKEFFKLELAVCWLCYFFAGNTLIEQTNLFWDKLDRQFKEFDEVMCNYGKLLIDGSIRDSRVFGSYMKLVYFYGNYRLLVHYYRPDSIETSDNHLIYQFLTADEWKQLEEQIPPSERILLNRIHLQRIRVSQLTSVSPEEDLEELTQKILAPTEFNQLRWLLQDRATIVWFMQQLSLEQKTSVVQQLLVNDCFEEFKHIIDQLGDDTALMEVILLSVYKRIVEGILVESNCSVAKHFSFERIFEFQELKTMSRIRKLLDKRAETQTEEANIGDVPQLLKLLKVLDQIRIDEVSPERKTIIVGINILIFADLHNCGGREVVDLQRNVLSKQLTFGTVPNLFKFLDVQTLIAIFGQSSSLIVALLRQTVINITEDALECFKSILEHFLQQPDTDFQLILLVFNCLQKNNANRKKLIPSEQFNELLSKYICAIDEYLAGRAIKKLRKCDPDCFSACLKGCSLVIRYKAVNKKELSDEQREMFLCYLDQALKADSQSSSALLTNALQHKDYLKLEPERIEQIVESRWAGFLLQLRNETKECKESSSPCINDDADIDAHLHSQHVKIFATFLTHHDTADRFTERLNQLERETTVDGSYSTKKFVLRVYTTFAKHAFASGVSQDVEKAFVRSFGNILVNDVLPLCVLKKFFEDLSCLEEIINCFSVIVANPKLTLVPVIMDNMINFLASINIKKYTVVDGEEKTFYQLHRSISDVLYLLMITRPNYVINRLPHYFWVFNQLIAAIISYKEGRPADCPLNSFEILTLSDLLLPLEKIMSLANKKVETDIRILAPYILMQIISFIVQSKRSTTLHEKISRTVYNICYELIAMYDKHSSGYILRTSDEASKNVYTDIVKNFRKYRSFKGKI
ncbi:uncharacterized protein LOC131690676 [Topomyia yanbarensis]|uniref:uncharacterized protein LOC131690676 n=1 Tax=Topomyia yanbarensis TaxID=2498891 RepID=UPI00273C3AF0|nr:uncharacterized protein LOC131690676 [Topomyia yanbarensis]